MSALYRLAPLALLIIALITLTPATHAIRSPSALAQRRRSAQETSSPTLCAWVGGADGTCDGTYGATGCCRPNPAYLLSSFPGTWAARVNGDGACSGVFAPTALSSVKQADIDKCYALGQQGKRCFVDFDPTTNQVSCKATTIWTGVDAISGCPGSFAGDYATCLFASRDECTKGDNADVCTNTFDDSYINSLTTAQKAALAKVMGGNKLTKLRDMDSCKPTGVWLGAAMGDTTKPFARINQEFGTYVSYRLRSLQPNDLWGSNCTLSAVHNRQSIITQECSGFNINKGKGTSVSADDIAQCLSNPNCEVAYEPKTDAKGVAIEGAKKAVCQASPGRTEGLMYSATEDDPIRVQIAAVYQACYAPHNRLQQGNCLIEQPYPQVFDVDYQPASA